MIICEVFLQNTQHVVQNEMVVIFHYNLLSLNKLQ